MGQVVTFAQLSGGTSTDGVVTAPITRGETKEMSAEYVRIEPGRRWSEATPKGADCYLFAVKGSGHLAAGAERHALPAETFATVAEGVAFTVENDAAAALDIVKVIAPPKPNALKGFAGTLDVAERARTPVVDVPAERKKRIIFVGHHATQSERAHAMIVVYDGQTNTPLHHHPNAESLFVLLHGGVEFTVNGRQEVLGPGQAVYFMTNDVHSLHTADGFAGASFLEFHIPGAFSTVKLAQSSP